MTHPVVAEASRHGVIAVLRAPSPDAAVEGAEALIRGGVRALEITYSTPDPASVIRELDRRHGQDVLLGAGTLTRPEQAAEVAEAGARFLVSPGSVAEVAEAMRATGAAVMLGALTPTEVMRAAQLGADVVKIFPASLGGPAFLRALRAPFPDLAFMPTGGVNPQNLADWFAAGAVAVGAGGELTPARALAEAAWDDVERSARRFTDALGAVRSAQP